MESTERSPHHTTEYINDMPVFNLTFHTQERQDEERKAFEAKVKDYSLENKGLNLKAGDKVNFISGYNSDLRYIAEILGFNEEGKAYILWQCWWFPVDLPKRDYFKVD